MSGKGTPDEETTQVECRDCGYGKKCCILPGYRGITLYWICSLSGRRVISTETCPRSRKRYARNGMDGMGSGGFRGWCAARGHCSLLLQSEGGQKDEGDMAYGIEP